MDKLLFALEPEYSAFRAQIAADSRAMKDGDSYEDVLGEYRLRRFLASTENDADEAVGVIRAHLKWRSTTDVDVIRRDVWGKPFRLASCPNAALLYGEDGVGMASPCVHAGFSRTGDVVHLEIIGFGDAKRLLERITEEQLLHHYLAFFELRSVLLERLSREKKRVIKTIQIRDMSNFGMHLLSERSSMLALSSLIKIGAENYPECTQYAIFTRCPAMFTTAWSILKRILPARTVKKVKFVSFADTPTTLMRYVGPQAIVGLQRLRWGEFGDDVADKPQNKTFERILEVPARSSEHIFFALKLGNKASFTVFVGEQEEDVPMFAEVIYVNANQAQDVHPDHVQAHTLNMDSAGYARCPDVAIEALVVITLDNSSSWFSSKRFRVDVRCE